MEHYGVKVNLKKVNRKTKAVLSSNDPHTQNVIKNLQSMSFPDHKIKPVIKALQEQNRPITIENVVNEITKPY